MAAVIPQSADKAKDAKAAAAVANSVPELRAAVETLAEAVEILQKENAQLRRRMG